MNDKNALLRFHMHCDPEFIVDHAIIAGKLAQKEFKTYQEYEKACQSKGLNCYNETLFDKFMYG